ncbi:uncharacterized protein METZ01_LOCUS197143, partial [marine metagenome]
MVPSDLVPTTEVGQTGTMNIIDEAA